ncbi:MAG: hypothetical protein JNL50_14190, partial [Phycisphaerae bacterium]|nr:hypothetical protein [Phycisphaerae bacterium]
DVLGFYVSSHPLETWKHWASTFANADTSSVKNMAQDTRAIVAGLVQSVRQLVVKSGRSAGQKMAIVTFEDTAGAMDCVLFTDAFARFGHLVDASSTTPVFLLGRVDRSRGEPQLIVERVVPIDGVPVLPGRLQLFFDGERLNGTARSSMERAAELVRAKAATGPADFPIEIAVASGGSVATMSVDSRTRVALDPDLIKQLVAILGEGCVRVVGGVTAEVVNGNNRPWEKKKRPVEV